MSRVGDALVRSTGVSAVTRWCVADWADGGGCWGTASIDRALLRELHKRLARMWQAVVVEFQRADGSDYRRGGGRGLATGELESAAWSATGRER